MLQPAKSSDEARINLDRVSAVAATGTLKGIIAEARKRKIKALILQASNKQRELQRLASSFAGAPVKQDRNKAEWTVPVPPGVKDKEFDAIVGAYRDLYGVDLSHMALVPSNVPRNSDATVNKAISPDMFGGSWARNNTVYLGKNLSKVKKNYNLSEPLSQFKKRIIAHELAHEVESMPQNNDLVADMLSRAREQEFTTPYLKSLPYPEKKDSELFAEYLSDQILNSMRQT